VVEEDIVVVAAHRRDRKGSRLGRRVACHIVETANLVLSYTAAAEDASHVVGIAAGTPGDIDHYMEAGNSSPVDAG
jgi:hypothetical protein